MAKSMKGTILQVVACSTVLAVSLSCYHHCLPWRWNRRTFQHPSGLLIEDFSFSVPHRDAERFHKNRDQKHKIKWVAEPE